MCRSRKNKVNTIQIVTSKRISKSFTTSTLTFKKEQDKAIKTSVNKTIANEKKKRKSSDINNANEQEK